MRLIITILLLSGCAASSREGVDLGRMQASLKFASSDFGDDELEDGMLEIGGESVGIELAYLGFETEVDTARGINATVEAKLEGFAVGGSLEFLRGADVHVADRYGYFQTVKIGEFSTTSIIATAKVYPAELAGEDWPVQPYTIVGVGLSMSDFEPSGVFKSVLDETDDVGLLIEGGLGTEVSVGESFFLDGRWAYRKTGDMGSSVLTIGAGWKF